MWKIAKVSRKLLDEAIPKAPVKNGDLRDSGHVEVISNDEAHVVFGNAEVDYVVKVHEKPGFSKGYKFLEKTADRVEDELIDMYEQMVYDEFNDFL